MNFDRISSSLDSNNASKLSSALRKKALQNKIAESSSNGDQGKSFSDTIVDSAKKINEYQKEADKQIKDLSLGNSKNIVKTMMTIERADISFRLATQIRNKVVDAYKELMRTAG